MKKLSIGQIVYTAMCDEHGGMIDDSTVFRLAENNFRWIGGNDDSGLNLCELAAPRNLNAWVRDSTNQLCNVAGQGPLSRDIPKQVVWTATTQPTLEEPGWFRFSVAIVYEWAGHKSVRSPPRLIYRSSARRSRWLMLMSLMPTSERKSRSVSS